MKSESEKGPSSPYSLSSFTNHVNSGIPTIPRGNISAPIRRHFIGTSTRISLQEQDLRRRSQINTISSSHTIFEISQNDSRPNPEDNSLLSLGSSKTLSLSLPRFNLHKGISELSFDEVCSDPTVTIPPKRLGFIPSSSWASDSIGFGLLVASFFRRRNSTNSKFPYKLYNALRITELFPEFMPHIGIKWISNDIIWVDREPFARLIGVKTVEGGLFHQQGNFPSHGFMELSFEDSEAVSRQYGLGKIDLSLMRLVRHINGFFTKKCKEEDIEMCRWKGN